MKYIASIEGKGCLLLKRSSTTAGRGGKLASYYCQRHTQRLNSKRLSPVTNWLSNKEASKAGSEPAQDHLKKTKSCIRTSDKPPSKQEHLKKGGDYIFLISNKICQYEKWETNDHMQRKHCFLIAANLTYTAQRKNN